MTALTAARAHLADILTSAGLVNVHPVMPEHITPPATIITPAAEWIIPDTLGNYALSLDVIVLHPGTNAVALEAVEADVDRILTAIGAEVWGLDHVTEPYPIALNGAQFLAAAITVNL